MSLTPDAFHSLRGRNILVMEPYFYTPKLETAFEISEMLARRNKVTFVGPDILRCTTDERFKLGGRFANSFSRKRFASRYLPDSVRKFSRSEIAGMATRTNLAEIAPFIELSGPELEQAMFEEFDLGMGLRSSLVSLTRNAATVPKSHESYSLALASDAVMLYRLTRELIRREGFDLVVLFNGRFAPARGIRRASEELGVQFFAHERGSSKRKFAIYDCATPHHPAHFREWANIWWAYTVEPERTAREFLDRRRRGVSANWYSFTRRQQPGNVPASSGRPRVAFFTSSEDEFAAIGDELRPDSPFCDQAYAIRTVGAACREHGHEFVVRFHPNTPSAATHLFRAASEGAAIIIDPANDVDSYALIDSSVVVVSQNSTIAIEAAANCKPSFFTGRGVYEGCRSVRRILTDQDLQLALATTIETEPLDALKYANVIGVHGIPYELYQPRGFFSGTYRGRNLNAPLSTLLDLRQMLLRGGR